LFAIVGLAVARLAGFFVVGFVAWFAWRIGVGRRVRQL
jgi:hypothetical protein